MMREPIMRMEMTRRVSGTLATTACFFTLFTQAADLPAALGFDGAGVVLRSQLGSPCIVRDGDRTVALKTRDQATYSIDGRLTVKP